MLRRPSALVSGGVGRASAAEAESAANRAVGGVVIADGGLDIAGLRRDLDIAGLRRDLDRLTLFFLNNAVATMDDLDASDVAFQSTPVALQACRDETRGLRQEVSELRSQLRELERRLRDFGLPPARH